MAGHLNLFFFSPLFPGAGAVPASFYVQHTRKRERESGVVVESDLKPVIKVVSCNGCAREERERGEGNNGKQQSWSH